VKDERLIEMALNDTFLCAISLYSITFLFFSFRFVYLLGALNKIVSTIECNDQREASVRRGCVKKRLCEGVKKGL